MPLTAHKTLTVTYDDGVEEKGESKAEEEATELAEEAREEKERSPEEMCDKVSSSPAGQEAGGTAASSGYTSLMQPQGVSLPVEENDVDEDEDDREFWNLMRDQSVPETYINRAIRRMQQQDQMSNNSSSLGSSSTEPSPRDVARAATGAKTAAAQAYPHHQQQQQHPGGGSEDVDLSVTSLGPFLDLLLEKVELMPSNSLATNLLVTSLLSRLSCLPQPLARSVLAQLPEGDSALQPSVRGLQTALSTLRHRLDNIMPTMECADEGIAGARRFLQERAPMGAVGPDAAIAGAEDGRAMQKRAEAAVASVASTISHLGKNTAG